MSYDQNLYFTDRSWELFFEVIERKDFQKNEARVIYEALKKRLRYVPFGDYLKRYIYRQAGLTGAYDEIGEDVYRQILIDSFREGGVPASFEPTTARIRNLAKNWLSQQTVRRSVVLLLGFGLKMTEDEVNEMLLKALHEQHLNEWDSRELICAYCYRNHCGFSTYERLMDEYRAMREKEPQIRSAAEAGLMARLKEISAEDGRPQQEVLTEKAYRALYAEAQELIAAMYDRTETFAGRTAADITESDLEHVLSSAIPTDRYGNLVPASSSLIDGPFAEYRISRQRLHRLLSGKSPVSRCDLITLSFFIWSQNPAVADAPKRRYTEFLKSVNHILKECSFGEIYPVNPYECFLLMCLLTEEPLSTYADVWEMVYRKET